MPPKRVSLPHSAKRFAQNQPDPYESDDSIVDFNDDFDNEVLSSEEEEQIVDSSPSSGSDEDAEFATPSTSDYYVGKDGSEWAKEPFPNTKTKSANTIRFREGPARLAKSCMTPLQCFSLFFDTFIIKKLVEYTNIFIDKLRKDRRGDTRLYRSTDEVEMNAFLGLLIMIGAGRVSKGHLKKLWLNENGIGWEICSATMSFSRFIFLLRTIHCDNINERPEKAKVDNFAIFREFFEHINELFSKHYVPSELLCIDEQLLRFRGRCRFKQYIPSKPAKYGLKVWAIVDVKTKYTVTLEPYVGKQPENSPFEKSTAPLDLVMRLCDKFTKEGRNLTGDNWFTSIPLVRKLLDLDTTYVGTIRKNKREIPPEFQAEKSKEEGSSMFGFQKDMSMVSYVPKKRRVVILVSSMHNDNAIDPESQQKLKPEIITFYNSTKYGVDVVDQMCENYNCARTTRKWPIVHFYNMINVSAINAYVIRNANNKSKMNRCDFLFELGRELCNPHLVERAQSSTTSYSVRYSAAKFANVSIERPPSISVEDARTRGQYEQATSSNRPESGPCYLCQNNDNKRTKTRIDCDSCKRFTCKNHLQQLCTNCFN
jgi:hypothetical protein